MYRTRKSKCKMHPTFTENNHFTGNTSLILLSCQGPEKRGRALSSQSVGEHKPSFRLIFPVCRGRYPLACLIFPVCRGSLNAFWPYLPSLSGLQVSFRALSSQSVGVPVDCVRLIFPVCRGSATLGSALSSQSVGADTPYSALSSQSVGDRIFPDALSSQSVGDRKSVGLPYLPSLSGLFCCGTPYLPSLSGCYMHFHALSSQSVGDGLLKDEPYLPSLSGSLFNFPM